MEGQLAYLGKEWRDEGEALLRAELDPGKMNGVSTSMADIYEACPGGGEKYLYLECAEGKVTRFETGVGESPAAEFSIRGSYETFAAITRGELSSQRALMTGKLKLRGNMAKAIRLAPLADRINKVLARIPTAY